MNMGPFFNSPSGGESSPEEMQNAMQRQAEAYVEASRKSLDEMVNLMNEWVRNRREDVERTEDVLRRMNNTSSVNEALDIYQHFVADRTRHFAEEAVEFPGKVGKVGLHAMDVVQRSGFPVPLPMSPMMPLMPVVSMFDMFRGPMIQMMRMIPRSRDLQQRTQQPQKPAQAAAGRSETAAKGEKPQAQAA